jgi:uncharacterized membrane protein
MDTIPPSATSQTTSSQYPASSPNSSYGLQGLMVLLQGGQDTPKKHIITRPQAAAAQQAAMKQKLEETKTSFIAFKELFPTETRGQFWLTALKIASIIATGIIPGVGIAIGMATYNKYRVNTDRQAILHPERFIPAEDASKKTKAKLERQWQQTIERVKKELCLTEVEKNTLKAIAQKNYIKTT